MDKLLLDSLIINCSIIKYCAQYNEKNFEKVWHDLIASFDTNDDGKVRK